MEMTTGRDAFSRAVCRLMHRTVTAGALCIGLVLLGVTGVTTVPAFGQDQVGVAAAVRGTVEVESNGVVRTPVAGESMLLGDRVRTEAQSGLQILLLDESVFTIGESNDLVIDRFIYDPDRSSGAIAIQATQGFFRFVSGRIGAVAPQNIELGTPSATIGVRGTSVDIIVGQAAIDLARELGLIEPGATVDDPSVAIFVILRGPTVSYGGITQRGRVTVATPAGSVNVRREGFGVFVPFAGAPPSQPVSVPQAVDRSVASSIELPDAGEGRTIGGVDITELPPINTPGGGGFPSLEGLPPDLAGPGFNPCTSGKGDPCAPVGGGGGGSSGGSGGGGSGGSGGSNTVN